MIAGIRRHHAESRGKGEEAGSLNKLLEYVGIVMLLGGIAGAVYFFLFFNTTVTTPTIDVSGQSIGGGQVNNIGLMADRQNGLILSIGSSILGTLLLFAGHSMTEKAKSQETQDARPAPPTPNLCASCGKYYVGSFAFCPNCGKPQRPISS